MKSHAPIILIGGGGHCKSVIEVAESAGMSILGIFDLPEKIGTEVLGYPVLGSDADIDRWADRAHFVVTVGQIKESFLRERLHAAVEQAGGALGTVIASTAHVSKHAIVAPGSVVLHGAMVNAGARIGKGCIINTLANIEHDVMVGDFCHISTGAMVNGDCRIGNGTFVGSQSVMLNGISIAPRSVVAAGSFIRKSITESGIYAGNPAVLIKK